ncbi:MAG: hypothetical protein Q8P12_00735 [bacterium]|nr:hypothetical protein [bacterium]
MADGVETQIEQPEVETPLAPEAPPEPQPPSEALDETGVPYKNRVAELQRRLEAEQGLNQRYQQALGQERRPQAPPPATQSGAYFLEVNGQKHEFDAASVALVRKLAEEIADQKANSIVGRAQLSNEVSDTEVRAEAENIYRNEVLSNQFYASWNDDAKQAIAIKEARARVFQKRYEAAKKGTLSKAQAEAAQVQAAGASLPGTSGTASPSQTSKEQYIKEFIKENQTDPGKVKIFRSFYQGLDPLSAEGIEKLKRSAEMAYGGLEFGGKTGAAIEHLSRGGR